MVIRIGNHPRMPRQNRAHHLPQLPDSFAMNDSNLENSSFPASFQIIQNQLLGLPWLKRVQVQHAINRKLERLFHAKKYCPRTANRPGL